MSLPLTRRIARVALLIAAGAAPVVGAAGVAAAAALPQTPNVGGVASLDGTDIGHTLDSASKQGARTANKTGGKVVGTTVPAAGHTLGKAGTVTNGLPAQGLTAKGLPIG